MNNTIKKIVTLIPFCGLDKCFFEREMGYIGYTFAQEKGYLSEVRILRKPGQKNFTIQGQNWIGFKNKLKIYFNLLIKARKVDILNIYHISFYSLLGSIIYKTINKNGKIYLKMDSPLMQENRDMRMKALHIPRMLMNILFKNIDYFGFEDKILQKFYKNTFPKYANKFLLTTSGFILLDEFIGKLKKENFISMVGKSGSKQKNNELLINVLKEFDTAFLKGWKIYMCGNATTEFIEKINELIDIKPELKGIIVLSGFLYKKDLYDILCKSRIFLHTANHEGDPNIQYEAMFTGCFMVSTDVANIKQNYPQEYSIFYTTKDKEGLYKALKEAIKRTEKFNEEDYHAIQNYAIKNFTRKQTLKEILEKF